MHICPVEKNTLIKLKLSPILHLIYNLPLKFQRLNLLLITRNFSTVKSILLTSDRPDFQEKEERCSRCVSNDAFPRAGASW
jgi:hypothetical protein